MSLSLSHWYPGSSVVLDCIDSRSLHPYLLRLATMYDFAVEDCLTTLHVNNVWYLIVSIPDLCTLTYSIGILEKYIENQNLGLALKI